MHVKLHIPVRPPSWRRVWLLPPLFAGLACGAGRALEPVIGAETPYLYFLGAVLLSTFYGGHIGGALATVVALFLAPLDLGASPSPPAVSAAPMILFLVLSGISVYVVEGLIRSFREEVSQKEQLALVRDELLHRMRNMLAVTESIARQTGSSSKTVEEYRERLALRLRALGLAQDLIGDDRNATTDLDAVITHALGPFAPDGKISIASCGPAQIDGSLVTPLALILNELATNASKYGALCGPDGSVSLSCEPRDREIRLNWVEIGGPSPTAPTRPGFGTALLRAAIPRSQGSIELSYLPEGLRCTIRLKTKGAVAPSPAEESSSHAARRVGDCARLLHAGP